MHKLLRNQEHPFKCNVKNIFSGVLTDPDSAPTIEFYYKDASRNTINISSGSMTKDDGINGEYIFYETFNNTIPTNTKIFVRITATLNGRIGTLHQEFLLSDYVIDDLKSDTDKINTKLNDLDNLDIKLDNIKTDTESILANLSTMETNITNTLDIINTDNSDIKNNVDAILDRVKRILGLANENIRMFDYIRDTSGNIIEYKIKTYDSKTDADTDINPLATYQNFTSYISGKISEFKVTKVN